MISQVPWWVFSLISVAVVSAAVGGAYEDQTKVYIVYLGAVEHSHPDLVTASHIGMLASLFGSEKDARESMIYSYRHGFSGFAAHMTDWQAKKLSEHPDVVQVTPNHYYQMQTTRTFDYLGLYESTPKQLLLDANMGEDVIIGVFDSGVWPESESFNDRGLGPIPARWKGKCVDGEGFESKKHCNKKLIGARYYIQSHIQKNKTEGITSDYIEQKEYMYARDSYAHGTHVASIAGGAFVPNVTNTVFGVGTARGGAPSAHIAVYKVCWKRVGYGGCAAMDILKAMDDAIEDGVDVMSLSLAMSIPVLPETNNDNEIIFGAFHAMSKGIPVLCASGNDGPTAYTLDNIAPWVITVAATSLDRWFPTPLHLGNNVTILARDPYKGLEIQADLIYVDSLYKITSAAKGKVVLVFLTESKEVVYKYIENISRFGLKAVIVASTRDDSVDQVVGFPIIVNIDYEQGATMMNYISSTSSPTIKISSAITLTGPLVATKVAVFSSRGPNSVSPYVLKPDVAAPGVAILAASTPSKAGAENGFITLSGTSMSTPVVAGVVALLRTIHRDWSPAAIHSALVTTASTTDPYGEPIFADGLSGKLADSFDFGGGLVNPTKAADPGLVYDASVEDYLRFLCSSGYEETSIGKMANRSSMYHCPSPRPSMLELNLPSITIPFLDGDVTVTRTVTNVGPIDSKYTVIVKPPLGVEITVTPNILFFNSFVKRLSFEVTVSTTHKSNSIYYFGSITWTDGSHFVSIPLSVRTERVMYFNH
ncbi:PREDICTED: subtilisin-like protease SBT3.11 [Camelina sativa]|uniref:Subtilisin-like protease SBT3.11 n=1 Tax=Camelina sativa TaxID=90675 RepID=A0ABM1QTC4_CAMSA|nr:PREDICTED: subtilisin-like protease SBT3.11 [Camelina sativa]